MKIEEQRSKNEDKLFKNPFVAEHLAQSQYTSQDFEHGSKMLHLSKKVTMFARTATKVKEP